MMSAPRADVPVGHMLNRIGLGLVVAFFNLKGFIAWAAIHWSPSARATDIVLAVTHYAYAPLAWIAGPGDTLPPNVAHWLVSGFWWYLAAIVVGGLVLWKPAYSAYSAGGLAAGLLWFPVLCWLGLVAFIIVRFCLAVVLFVLGAIGWILGLFAPLVELLARVFGFLLPWIALLAAIAGVVAAVVWMVRHLRGRPLLLLGVAAGLGLLAYAWLPGLARFWAETLLPVLRAIGGVLGTVLGVVFSAAGTVLFVLVCLAVVCMVLALVAGLLGLLGWLLADQFRAAWLGGTGRTSMFLSGFSVGTATAMILMVCIGLPDAGATLDGTWHTFAWLGRGLSPAALFAAVLPFPVTDALSTMLQDASAPVFDSLLLLALFACAALGMFRLGEQRKELPLGAYLADGKRFGLLSGAAVAAPLLVVLVALMPSDDA